MALRGNLRDFSLPDVFQLVTLSRKTGVLRIHRSDAEGSVWFRDGEVFFAQSNWHHEALGTRMVSAGKIAPSGLARALEVQRSEPDGGRRLGRILVDEGYVTEKVLEAFVQEQIQDTIFDLFRWDEGDFDFEPLPEFPIEEDIGLSVSIENIVMEGSRRLEEWTRIKKKIPSMDLVFKMATAPGEGTFDISLKPAEWNLLLKTDGTRSVAQLARETGHTDFEVARVVYGLFSAGLLEVASDEEVERLRSERARLEERMAALRAASAQPDVVESVPVETPAPPIAPGVPQPGPEPHAEARVEAAELGPTPVEEPAPAPALEPEPEPEPESAPEPRPEPELESAPGPEHVVETPAFLAGQQAEPTADDMAMFEQMLGAVLEAPASDVAEEIPTAAIAEEPPAAPVAAESAVPEVESAAEVPLVEVLVETAPTMVSHPDEVPQPEARAAAEALPIVIGPSAEETGPEPADIADDLAGLLDQLGLVTEETEAAGPEPVASASWEMSPEMEPLEVDSLAGLLAGEPEEVPSEEIPEAEPIAGRTGDFAADLLALGLGELPGPDLLKQVAPEAAEPAREAEVPAEQEPSAAEQDLSELLSSLTETSGPAVEPDPLLAHANEQAAGVISTDAFLADFDHDATFSTGMSDELTALTGGGKARPAATAGRIPEPEEPGILHRDVGVDKDLVLKVIEGVRRL
jgi:hypothetical protein